MPCRSQPLLNLSGPPTKKSRTLLNLTAVIAAVVLLGRYGGRAYGLGLLAVFTLYFFRPDEEWPWLVLVDVWNPNVIIHPFVVLLVLCARLASGHANVLPWIVLVASFVVQTHIGNVPTTASVVATAMLTYILRRARRAPDAGWNCVAAVGVFVLLWGLPLLEQLRGGPDGNLARIVSFFTAPSPTSIAFPTTAESFNAFSYALWIPIRGTFDPPLSTTIIGFRQPAAAWAVLQLSLLAGLGVWAARARQTFRAVLCLVGLVAAAAAFWSVSRVQGVLYGYLIYWILAISVVNTAVLVGSVMDWTAGAVGAVTRLRLRSAVLWPVAVGVFSIALTVQGVFTLHDVQRWTLNTMNIYDTPVVRLMSAAIEADMQRHERHRPLIRTRNLAEGFPHVAAHMSGVVWQFHKAGIPLAVDDQWLFVFRSGFRSTGSEDVEYVFRGEPFNGARYRQVAQLGGTFVYGRDRQGSPARAERGR